MPEPFEWRRKYQSSPMITQYSYIKFQAAPKLMKIIQYLLRPCTKIKHKMLRITVELFKDVFLDCTGHGHIADSNERKTNNRTRKTNEN